MHPRMSRSSPAARRAALLAVAAAALATAGCSSITTEFDNLFGIGSSKANVLIIQSMQLRSDRPSVISDPTSPVVLGSNDTVRFTAVGTFLIEGTLTTQTNDVSAGVVWASSNPGFALPGSDGRVAARGSAGTASITATSPALGSIPALTSNAIALTIP